MTHYSYIVRGRTSREAIGMVWVAAVAPDEAISVAEAWALRHGCRIGGEAAAARLAEPVPYGCLHFKAY